MRTTLTIVGSAASAWVLSATAGGRAGVGSLAASGVWVGAICRGGSHAGRRVCGCNASAGATTCKSHKHGHQARTHQLASH